MSNFETGEMIEAASYLRKVPLACNQVLYHLCERGIEHALIPTGSAKESRSSPTRRSGVAAFLRSAPAAAKPERIVA